MGLGGRVSMKFWGHHCRPNGAGSVTDWSRDGQLAVGPARLCIVTWSPHTQLLEIGALKEIKAVQRPGVHLY